MLGRHQPRPNREQRIAERAQRNAVQAQTCLPRRAAVMGGTTTGTTVAKECASQHAGYQDAVRGLGRCMRCGCTCRPQFCHRDQGKGMGIKTDVREGWAGCPECHHLVGTSGTLPKPTRRAVEILLAAHTRAEVEAAGTWPARLERWPA